MKIATVTTHYANNYGALLQTFALQKFLTEGLKHDAEVLAYYPPNYKSSWNIISKPKTFKDFLLKIYSLTNLRVILGNLERKRNNLKFISQNIKLSKEKYYNRDAVYNENLNYDCYICGSDQIWNFTLRDEPIFYLDFNKNKNTKKIAYAPSIADDIPKSKELKVKKYLKNLDAISVREDKDVEILKKLTSKNVVHVADPIFLLKKEEWVKKMKPIKINGPYILCYFLSPNNLAKKTVEKLKKTFQIPVVYLNINVLNKLNSDYEIRNADPIDFISYINKATVVCTNSFHCTAFSILLEKNFYIVPKANSNSRMESLQRTFKIEDRFIRNFKNIDKIKKENYFIDYSLINKNLNKFRNSSKNYLKKALGE